ncbi:chemerin-like receptor 1 [Leptodactylus fuscus]|uniref:chemerin-like receptor 1 n=1 Tax=Leptodactylus fuscus TaxID=238119 RepID=UPI003F4EEE21
MDTTIECRKDDGYVHKLRVICEDTRFIKSHCPEHGQSMMLFHHKPSDFYNITGPTMIINGTSNNSLVQDNIEVYNDNGTLVKNLLNRQFYFKIYHLVIFSMVCLLGTIGNGLVLWFCLFRMEKTVNVVWFLNLAIADFTFAMLLPFLITSIALDYHWPFGNFICRFTWFFLFLNMAISVLQLTVISADRCICVVFPVWCHNHRTRRLALIVVLVIWVVSITLSLPSYIFRSTVVGRDKISCNFQAGITWAPILRFVVFFLVPFLAIVLCYTVIVLRIKEKSFIKTSKPFKIIVVMVMAFFLCWFPYNFCVLLGMFQLKNTKDFLDIGIEVGTGLMLLNSCINPILYVLIGQDFKQKFCGSFQAIFEKAFTEDISKIYFKKREGHSSFELTLTSNDTI